MPGGGRSMATGPIETHLHRSFNWENGAPGPQEGPRGRSANCGNGLFAQCVRLRSEINHGVIIKLFVPRPRFESMRCCHKRKRPRCRRLSISIGAAYRIPRIRSADPRRLRPPAGALARSLRTLRVRFTLAPRPRFESMGCRRKKKKPPVAGGFQFQLVRRIGFEPMTF